VPTSALWAFRAGDQRAKRLLFTGDLIDGATALEWGLAIEAPPAADLDEHFEALLRRVASSPAGRRRPASSRPCASATSRTAVSATSEPRIGW
jgi:enoyl-CoA hydratase/carnithine racemase